MAKKDKQPTDAPLPTGSDEKVYLVRLTEREMQCLAHACAGFYRVANREKLNISPEQSAGIVNALGKMKEANMDGPDIEVVQSLI